MNQRGAALLTVILLAGTLAALAVMMTEIMTRALSRASASELRDQGSWAMAGLEDAALSYLREQAEVLDAPGGPLFASPIVLLSEAGTVTMRFFDASNCFNVNDLLARDGEELIADEAAALRFAGLVRELGGSPTAGQQLASRIADFADTDERPQPGSVDDFDYQRREVPYRSAGTLLASVSELRAVAGFSADVYRALLGHLCALPTDGEGVLNVNTLGPEDAPLLASTMGQGVTINAAERIIAARPPEGYEEVAGFLQQPMLAGAELPKDLTGLIGVKPSLIGLEIVLATEQGRLRRQSLIYRGKQGGLQVVERSAGERLP